MADPVLHKKFLEKSKARYLRRMSRLTTKERRKYWRKIYERKLLKKTKKVIHTSTSVEYGV